jgi:putative NIF3 family GTP cyclohydrolase 1 type 2
MCVLTATLYFAAAPLPLAETSWDNVGILLQAPAPELNRGKKIFLAIDLTSDVTDEVLSDGHVAALIIYHP